MPRRSLARPLCAAVLVLLLSPANAEAPKSGLVGGIRLGDNPANVTAFLQQNYSQCDLQRSVYRAEPGEKAGPLAQVAINEGTINTCEGTPEDPRASDIIVVRFVHPSIDPERGVYEILFDRAYPDPALSTADRQIRYPYDKLLAQLRRQYGKPTDERRDRQESTSAGHARSLGLRATVKREDYVVRLLWAPQGKTIDPLRPADECDCGGDYVQADIEITRSPGTRPANRFYVVRMTLYTRNADVRQRQDAWNTQWQRREK